MSKLRILTLMIVLLLAITVFAEENRTNVNTRGMLEASGNFDNNGIETIIRLLDEKTNIDEIDDTIASDNRGYIDSDNWQVVRITGVASENHPDSWEEITEYDTITSLDHGGSRLLFRTVELALNPLYGIVNAEAKFRYWNATELNSEVINTGLYQLTTRFWAVQNNITSGKIRFEADYAQQVGHNVNQVHLHRELDVR